jgi:hypothetical protein
VSLRIVAFTQLLPTGNRKEDSKLDVSSPGNS